MPTETEFAHFYSKAKDRRQKAPKLLCLLLIHSRFSLYICPNLDGDSYKNTIRTKLRFFKPELKRNLTFEVQN